MKTKRYLFIAILINLSILRFLLSYKIPNFYISNLGFDDALMINKLKSLLAGNYLGEYSDTTLVKGVVFPLFLYITKSIGISYSMSLTILYIFACLFFIFALRKVINNKKILVIIYVILLFNPVSYSSELLQRLYRNSLSIIELLFFLGIIINIIYSKKNNIINYVFLGIITSIMILTREETTWTSIILVLLFIFKIYKNISIKTIMINSVPVLVIVIILNIVSFINYKNYNIYTYDELSKTDFKDAYIKILEIKDDKKIDKVSITKNTIFNLMKKAKTFNLDKEQMEYEYSEDRVDTEGEIYNGNILWYLRYWIYRENRFKDGEMANNYWKELSNEIDKLFGEGKLEKKFVIPAINIYMPTENEIKELPKNFIEAIKYTSSYENIKTINDYDMKYLFRYDAKVNAYYRGVWDYHNAENITKNNPFGYEIIRNIYKYFTIIFSIIALVVYIKNILIKDKLNFINHIILITYLIIICGVTYTHTTAFAAIRYCYLGNIYILQSIFIMINLYRFYIKHRNKEKNKIYLLGDGSL